MVQTLPHMHMYTSRDIYAVYVPECVAVAFVFHRVSNLGVFYPQKRDPNPSCQHALPSQLLDLFLARPQNLSKNFVGMLAEQGWRTTNAWRRVGVLDRGVDHLQRPTGRVVDLGDHVPRQH